MRTCWDVILFALMHIPTEVQPSTSDGDRHRSAIFVNMRQNVTGKKLSKRLKVVGSGSIMYTHKEKCLAIQIIVDFQLI
jgi:hypothetical protein